MFRIHHFLRLTTLLLLLPYLAHCQDEEDWIDFPTTLGSELSNSVDCIRYCFNECRYHNIPILNCSEDPTMGCDTNGCLCGDQDMYNQALSNIEKCATNGCSHINGAVEKTKNMFVKYCEIRKQNLKAPSSTLSISKPSPTYTSTSSPEDLGSESTPTPNPEDQDPDSTSTPSPDDQDPDSTSTPSPDDQDTSGRGNSFDAPEIAGTVIGAFSALAAAIGIWLQIRHRRKKNSNNAGSADETTHMYPPAPQQYQQPQQNANFQEPLPPPHYPQHGYHTPNQSTGHLPHDQYTVTPKPEYQVQQHEQYIPKPEYPVQQQEQQPGNNYGQQYPPQPQDWRNYP